MDIENEQEVSSAVENIKKEVDSLDGILHAIAFSPTEAMGGNFLNTSVEDAVKSFEISAFSLKTLATSFQPLLNNPLQLLLWTLTILKLGQDMIGKELRNQVFNL